MAIKYQLAVWGNTAEGRGTYWTGTERTVGGISVYVRSIHHPPLRISGLRQDVPTQAHADKCESLKALTVMKAPKKEEVPVPAPRYHEYHGQIPEKVSPSGQTLIIALSSLSASSVTVTVRVESQPEVTLEPQQRHMEHITSHIDLARASQPFPRQSNGRDLWSTRRAGKSGARCSHSS